MSSYAPITLIIVGAILILAPLVIGMEVREHVAATHAIAQSAGSVIAGAHSARGGRLYALICLLTGLGCLIAGIVRSKPQPSSAAPPTIQRPAA